MLKRRITPVIFASDLPRVPHTTINHKSTNTKWLTCSFHIFFRYTYKVGIYYVRKKKMTKICASFFSYLTQASLKYRHHREIPCRLLIKSFFHSFVHINLTSVFHIFHIQCWLLLHWITFKDFKLTEKKVRTVIFRMKNNWESGFISVNCLFVSDFFFLVIPFN